MITFNDRITLEEVEKVLHSDEKIQVSGAWIDRVEACYRFLEKFAAEKVIYGINTGFGPMAQWRVDDKYLIDLQYNIIRSHSTGAGEPLDDIYVKSAMIARLGTVLQCRSGVHTDVVKLLVEFIFKDLAGVHQSVVDGTEDLRRATQRIVGLHLMLKNLHIGVSIVVKLMGAFLEALRAC